MSTQENLPIEPVAAPVASPEPAAVVDAPAAAPPNESRRETIERNFKATLGKPRDERGKFSASSKPSPEVPLPSPETAISTVPERPSMPKSYKKELESHWGVIPQEFAAAVAQRESDYEKGVQPLKERARVADEFLNAVKPYEQMIRAEGGSPIAAVQSLLQTAQVLRDPAQRVPAIASLMQQYQVSIEDLQQALAGNGSPQPSYNPQYVSQLVKQELTAYQQQQSEQQNEAEVERFASNPEHKHFQAVQDWMGPILSSEKFRAEHPGASAQDKLKAAYTLALNLDPELRAQVAAEQQAASVAANQVSQARRAAVMVKGSPPSGAATKIDPKDRRALIEHNLRIAHR